jgi:YbgC/YbaW family acyl-CoA thioester hydrolase
MYDPATKIYTLPITVEFEDVDSYNIVHNTRIIDYFERARVHFITETIGLNLYPDGVGIVVYSLDVRFTRAARFLDALKASVFIRALDDYRLTLGYRLRRGREVLARATSGIAFMDTQSGTIVPAPEIFCKKIKPFIQVSDTTALK